ncbi:unnamed protein product [Mytilus edulis]|uniref:Uncharacterized protein n=1 Tax=Mytilus edulis TaxID=6550 RepID=A0A8S3SN36_MYTED|nr:unnamed protein product [Mytilus edulis]
MAVVLSSFLICVYIIYIVLLSVIYHKKTDLYYTLLNYTTAYQYTLYGYQHISYWNRVKTFPEFMQKLGCQNTNPERYHCWSLYVQELGSYLEIYLGIIVTCIICQICSIVAAEYIFRKLEFKEKKTSISENKYFLLLSLNHGIFRSWIISIKQKWNRSKIIFASVMLKISSLVAGLGLLVLGLTLIGDVFITDGSLKHIFYKIQFYHYYFYDILVGLAAASVVIGMCTLLVAVLGLVGSWRKSKRFLITSSVLSLALHIPRLITVVLWIVFIAEITNGMKFQLWLQQLGYFYGGNGNRITGHWNNMIMTLQCCGVNYYSETHTTQGIKFCCKNAHPRILDKEDPNTNSYYGLFDYFGGCGGYKTDTCAEVILFKTKMFVDGFLVIVLLQIVLEVIGILFANKEYSDIMTTKSTDKSTGEEMYTKSVIFRTVFRGIKLFFLSNWKRCATQCYSVSHQLSSCDDAVEKRVETYSMIFFVFMAINISTEMCCVIMIVYNGLRLKNDSKKVHLDVIDVDNTKEIQIEMEKHILEPSMENEALKSRKKKKKKSKSGKISQTNKSKTRESIEIQKKENTIIQEQSVNTNELQPIKSMEFEDNEKVNGDSKQIDKISGTNDGEEVDTFAEYYSMSDTHTKDATETTDL